MQLASSSPSQVQTRTASAAARLAWERPFGSAGRLGVNWSRGCNRPCAPLVSGRNIAVCQDPGGQAERQDRSTEASTTRARSARTRSTQTGGSPGRGTAARRATLAPRRPGSWKASRELPRRRTAQNAPDRARLAGPGPALQHAPLARLSRSIPSVSEGAIASGCGSPVRAAGCCYFGQPSADVRGHGRHWTLLPGRGLRGLRRLGRPRSRTGVQPRSGWCAVSSAC